MWPHVMHTVLTPAEAEGLQRALLRGLSDHLQAHGKPEAKQQMQESERAAHVPPAKGATLSFHILQTFSTGTVADTACICSTQTKMISHSTDDMPHAFSLNSCDLRAPLGGVSFQHGLFPLLVRQISGAWGEAGL